MLKIIETSKELNTQSTVNTMKELQVGVIKDSRAPQNGEYVMRTASSRFEVLSLSDPASGNCWDRNCDYDVRLLKKGESITLKLFNEEES